MTDANFNLGTLHAPVDVRAAIDRLVDLLRSQLDTMSAEEVDQRTAAFSLLGKKESELTPDERHRVDCYLNFVYGPQSASNQPRHQGSLPQIGDTYPIDERVRRLEIAIAIERDLSAGRHAQLVDALTEVAILRSQEASSSGITGEPSCYEHQPNTFSVEFT